MGPEQRSQTTYRTRLTSTRSPAAFLSPRAARPATRPLARSRQAPSRSRASAACSATWPLARSRPLTRSRQAPGASELESKCGLLGHAATDALSTGRPPGNAAAGALSACVTKLKGTHHSISDVALTRLTRSRPALTRSRARAARSAMRPPTRARPTAHKLSGNTGTNYARRAESTERRAAAQTTAGARH